MTDWPEIARCFSVLRPARWVDPEALEYLKALDSRQAVIVACSGGADSVFLVLTMLDLLGPECIHVAHFNHGIRGAEADQDAVFVEQLSDALGIQFFKGQHISGKDSSEAALRDARYRWLIQVYQQAGAAALLLGHHADDLLETQLIGLLTGSGPSGLASPMPVRRFSDGHVRVRPLLPMKRSTIEKTLLSLNVPWCEDKTNQDTSYTRNWIRKDLLPLLQDRFPQDIHAGSARTRKLQREALDAIDRAVDRMGISISDPCGFDAAPLKTSPKAVIRRCIFAWWMRHHAEQDLPTKAADKLVETLAQGDGTITITVGSLSPSGAVQSIHIDGVGYLHLSTQPAAKPAWTSPCHWHWQAGPVYIPPGARLTAKTIAWGPGETPYRDANPSVDAWISMQTGPLVIRQWQPGDRYRPLGAPGSRKLQDIFSDAKLNSEQKQALPVLLNNNGEILWVPGFPPAESAKVSESEKSALRLTYRGHSTAFQ